MSNEESGQQIHGESAGSLLRRERERKGLSLSDIADAQHLRPVIIQAIENGDYQQVDSELFLKGYVRAYAKHVGLDADAVVATLDQELEPLRLKKAEALEANPLVDIERRKRQKRKTARILGFLVAIAIAAGVVLYVLNDRAPEADSESASQGAELSESASSTETEQVPATESGAEMQPEPEPEPEASVEPENEISRVDVALPDDVPPASDDEGAVESGEVDESRFPEVTSSTDPALTESSTTGDVPDTARLEISFLRDCWVEVTDSSGARLVSSLQQDGDRVDVSGQVPLNVVIGAVDAVEAIRFQGESVELSDYRVVNNRAQFSLEI
ncbi:RodZ domain-containing protein [Marinobacter sp.]|uniref:RodZ domain-containing protein n=1 Tax=Marinobacter sp. TaxID=50741 RepID=UPI0034A2FCE4